MRGKPTVGGVVVLIACMLTLSAVIGPVLAAPATTQTPDRDVIAEQPVDGTAAGENIESRGQGNGNGGPPGNDGGGSPGTSTDGDTGPESNLTIPAYIENATVEEIDAFSSLEQRAWALSQLEEIKPANRKENRRVTDAFEGINESVLTYVEWSRVEQPGPFDADRSALKAFRHVDASALNNVSTALVASDRSIATKAISDAEFVFEEFEGQIEIPGQQQKAKSQINNAKNALDRGDQRRSNGERLQRDRQAINQYEQAWKHARKAIETVDGEVELSLSVSAEQHEPGNETITYPISGSITAPSATIETVDMYVNGEFHKTVNVSTVQTPGVPEHFETKLELATTEATVRVIASDGPGGEEVSETITLDAPGFADEVYDIELTEPESGATITVTGEGVVKSDFLIDHVPADEARSFHAGSFIHIRNFIDFESATVEIPLKDGVDPSDGNLSVYKWDQHDEKPWHAVESEVDVENGTAIAKVDSFSYFSVFWVDNWNDAITDTVNLDEHPEYVADESDGSIEPIDLAFVIDVSGSMSGDRISHAKASAKRFVGGLYEDDQVGLVSFASSGTLKEPLTTGHDAVNASVDQLRTGGGTNTGAGLQQAIDELTTNGGSGEQEIILLADGGTNAGPNPVEIAQQADEEGITINTIGMGTGINARELTNIADATGGEFYQVSDSSELPEVFDRIEQNRISLVDSDGDGIPDAVEEMSLPMSVGSPPMVGLPVGLDSADDHTANVRLPDGEITEFQWATYEEDGDPMITAKMVDASVHPGSGEPVRKEVLKIGVMVPTLVDADTRENVFTLKWNTQPGAEGEDGNEANGYALAQGPDHIPAEGSCFIGCWVPGQSKHPDWLPAEDVIENEEQYHLLIENVEIYLQYSHDVATEDIPTKYELSFEPGTAQDIHVYDNYGDLSVDETITQTDIVVAGPDRQTNLPFWWEEVGILNVNFDVNQDSPFYIDSEDENGNITIRSAEPYHYRNDIRTEYQDTYEEAMKVLQDGLISAAGGGPLGSVQSAASTLLISQSMATASGVFVLEKGTSRLVDVIDGYNNSEYDMYQSVIYQNTTHEGRVSLPEEGLGNKWVTVDIAGTGPILLRVNYPDLDVEDDMGE